MRSFAGLLFVCSLSTPYVLGGAITSGGITLGFGAGNSASFSGSNFSAQINDFDSIPGNDGGFMPFVPPSPNITDGVGLWSAGMWSGLSYNGIGYQALNGNAPIPGYPYASSFYYSVVETSPAPLITGPGEYPVTVSVQLNFCLSDLTGSISNVYCESDTGIATGAYNYYYGNDIFDFLSGHSLDLTIADPSTVAPEPSTLSYVGLTLCFGFFVTTKNRERFVTASLQRQRHR